MPNSSRHPLSLVARTCAGNNGNVEHQTLKPPYRTALGPCFGDESAVGPNMSLVLQVHAAGLP